MSPARAREATAAAVPSASAARSTRLTVSPMPARSSSSPAARANGTAAPALAAIAASPGDIDCSATPSSASQRVDLAVLAGGAEPGRGSCSKRGFADWRRTTAADRFTTIPASALDNRRFWDAMHAVALDMTNFATFIDTGNGRAPIAQRGKAKQKQADLRLVGLGLVVTRDGGIPLLSHAYPGSKPDVTQFPQMIQVLAARHAALAAATGQDGTEMTVVFDAGQNSEANFALLAGTNLRYVGSVPASDYRDLLALPADARTVVDKEQLGGLTACGTRREIYGTERRATLTHSPELHEHQARGFDGTTLPRPPGSWMSWPPPWPAVKPAGPGTRLRRRSPRSPATRGLGASSPGSWTAATLATCG